MTVVLSQVVFWINKESVPARTVAGIRILFFYHLLHSLESIVLYPLYQTANSED